MSPSGGGGVACEVAGEADIESLATGSDQPVFYIVTTRCSITR